jgi:hypothetical protein
MDAPGFACGNKERHPWVEEVYLETVGLQMPVGVRLGFLYDINLYSLNSETFRRQ